jgi:hypothetical protein
LARRTVRQGLATLDGLGETAHSERNAMTGSTDAARCAGTQQLIPAIAKKTVIATT